MSITIRATDEMGSLRCIDDTLSKCSFPRFSEEFLRDIKGGTKDSLRFLSIT
jgi:hypothetical protein